MTTYVRCTPYYEPGILPITAKQWLMYLRTTLDILEMDIELDAAENKRIKRVSVDVVRAHCDEQVKITVELEDVQVVKNDND